jgi:hypothetical protein
MKKYYLIFTTLFSVAIFGQSFSNFNNTIGDGKWSTAGNWSAGLPTQGAQLNQNVDLDTDQTITNLLRSSANTLTGNGKLTSTGAATDNVALLCTGANFNFNGKIEINNPNVQKALQVNNAGTTNRQLTLGATSVLTLTTPARVVTQLPLLSKVVFRGIINGSANLQISGTSEFDTMSNNSDFNGDIIFTGSGANVTVNTTGVGAFLKAGRKVQVNNPNCSITINGANSCKGNLSVDLANPFTLNINANQEEFGSIKVGDSPLTINVATAVTNLSFADSSTAIWGTAVDSKLVFTGFQPGEIRFGTTNTALSAEQLAKISADGVASGNQALGLDANGYLVLASTLSSNSFDLENQNRISYPTLVNNQLYLSKPQNKVDILNITGNKIFSISDENGINLINTSELSSGVYIIVLEGVKSEKFIKK